jgi:hypothetical protein
MSSLKDSFLNYCKRNNYEKNIYQLKILDFIVDFLNPKKNFLDFFLTEKKKNVFIYTVV